VALPVRYKKAKKSFDAGGMADVELYTDIHLEREVVIKTLKNGVDSKRILDEIAALQAVRSKHVVQMYDVIKNSKGEVTAIVEEYLPGDDLTSYPKPTTADEFLEIIYQIAEGIADIHTHGQIHRDIKRQNMKLDGEGCLKIFDFGLARGAAVASTVGEIGTPGYMAPELFEMTSGGHVTFTKSVDVFAFGATAVALALGSVPNAMREAPPVLPCKEADFSKLPLKLSPDIASVLNRCLSKKSSDRPAMSDVAALIGRHLLRDKHRALLVYGKTSHSLHSGNRKVVLSVANQGAITINYDGLSFVITAVSGSVAINNMTAVVGNSIPGSCVIVLGSGANGASRTSITVDVSHPEVAL
jgi:serine/threonine-protein kinase